MEIWKIRYKNIKEFLSILMYLFFLFFKFSNWIFKNYKICSKKILNQENFKIKKYALLQYMQLLAHLAINLMVQKKHANATTSKPYWLLLNLYTQVIFVSVIL
jgi:hypothetical protein